MKENEKEINQIKKNNMKRDKKVFLATRRSKILPPIPLADRKTIGHNFIIGLPGYLLLLLT